LRVAATAVAMAILTLAGCADRDLWPAERLDPKSAVNVTVMAEPWVYARSVPMLAANARDYLNVGIVETNRAGSRAYWLGAVSWSTIDRSVYAATSTRTGPMRVRFDWSTTKLELTPAAAGRSAVGLSTPVFAEPGTEFEESWYSLSTDQVTQLGAGVPTAVSLMNESGESTTYEAWRANPAVMVHFLKATGLDRP